MIAVLALQGAFQKHVDVLNRLGVKTQLVRKPEELDSCAGLIIPGGESTTFSRLIEEAGMFDALQAYAAEHPVMGVCAGMIMMAAEVDDLRVKPLKIMSFRVIRNYYGRQLHSFSAGIQLGFDAGGKDFNAIFIRAPQVTETKAGVKVLATYQDKPVMLASGKHLALSFHPELTRDDRIHQYWLSQFNN